MKVSIAFDLFYRPAFKARPETCLAASTDQVILNLLQGGRLPDAGMRTAVDPQLLLYKAEQSAASQMLDTGADPNQYLPCMIVFACLFPECCNADDAEWLSDLSRNRFPACEPELATVASNCRKIESGSGQQVADESATGLAEAFVRLCRAAESSAAYRIAEAASSLAHDNGWTREDQKAA